MGVTNTGWCLGKAILLLSNAVLLRSCCRALDSFAHAAILWGNCGSDWGPTSRSLRRVRVRRCHSSWVVGSTGRGVVDRSNTLHSNAPKESFHEIRTGTALGIATWVVDEHAVAQS